MIEHLRQIAIFAKTIDHGSFRGAARDLRLSPSVVSHHISELEEHLGVALLYRSTRKLALTNEGKRLLVSAQQMLEAVDQGLADISTSASRPTGELRITAPSVLAQSQLTDSIGKFSRIYPGINLSLNFTDFRQEIIEGGFDIAIRMSLGRKPSASGKSLFRVKRRLVASMGYLAERSEPTSPSDIVDWDWLELSPVFHIKPTFRKTGQKPFTVKTNAQINANDARALYQLVCSGAGLAIVPEMLAENDIASGDVEIVLPDWDLGTIDVFAEWPSNAPRNGLIRILVNHLAGELVQH